VRDKLGVKSRAIKRTLAPTDTADKEKSAKPAKTAPSAADAPVEDDAV
jgi:hypothetical protein